MRSCQSEISTLSTSHVVNKTKRQSVFTATYTVHDTVATEPGTWTGDWTLGTQLMDLIIPGITN